MKKILLGLLLLTASFGQSQIGGGISSTINGQSIVSELCDTLTDVKVRSITKNKKQVCEEFINGKWTLRTCDNVGYCVDKESKCVESQEWTYGIDNTGTTYDWPNAEYQLTLSDGSTLTWTQTTASNPGWSAQLTEWAASIQSSADAAGLSWLVEPRAVNNYIPDDISGGYGVNSNATGLPGAPSVPVAIALIDGGMAARYVNIQICPGQPVPVDAVVLSHDDSPRLADPYDNGGRVGYELTTAGAVLGPIQKFRVCESCGEAPRWYLEEGVTLASAGQSPFCSAPCGTLTLADSPPDRECDFQTIIACDNNNQNVQANFTNTITRRAKVCDGEEISVDYFQSDPDDPSALIAYTLVGKFVDCATGEDVPLPIIVQDTLSELRLISGNVSDTIIQNILSDTSRNHIKVTVTGKDTCVIPANLECIKKRSFNFVYDNGFTPGSSTNNCDERNNLVRYNWDMTSNGWQTGAGVLGVGSQIGAYTGWTPQLQGWNAFGNSNDPYGSVHSFQSIGAPTYRSWVVNGCNPDASYGSWELVREDGCEFTVYPVLYTEKIERIWTNHTQDCDGIVTTKYYTQNADGITYTEVAAPSDVECFVSCDYSFKPVIIPGAESPCTTTEKTLCDRIDPNDSSQDVQFVLVTDDCEGEISKYRYTFDSYNNATNPDDLVEYNVIGDVVICGSNDVFVEPEPVIIVDECTKYNICIDGNQNGWQVKAIKTNGELQITYEDETGTIKEPNNWTIGDCDCDLSNYWTVDGITEGLRNREWHDTEPAVSPFPTDAEAGRNFRLNHDFSLIPDTDNIQNDLGLNDTNNTAAELDIQVKQGYVIVEDQIAARYAGASEGYWAVEIGYCCGAWSLVAESGGFSPDREMLFTIPQGIHAIRIWNIDSGGSNSSATFSYSLDGITYINDNTPPGIELSQTKPKQTCEDAYICNGTWYESDKETPITFDAFTMKKKLECVEPKTCNINIVD